MKQALRYVITFLLLTVGTYQIAIYQDNLLRWLVGIFMVATGGTLLSQAVADQYKLKKLVKEVGAEYRQFFGEE